MPPLPNTAIRTNGLLAVDFYLLLFNMGLALYKSGNCFCRVATFGRSLKALYGSSECSAA